MADIHLFFKDGKRSYYPIVYPATGFLISGLRKRLLASKRPYARDQFNREVAPFVYRSLSYIGISGVYGVDNRDGNSKSSRLWMILSKSNWRILDHWVKPVLERKSMSSSGCCLIRILSFSAPHLLYLHWRLAANR